MSIKKLPEYLINKLKAWEIVERPASVVKELLENSLDAGATKITLDINDWGKTMIRLEDNGSGIDIEDLDFVLERYATSKITQEEDLYNIASYGFRGEALASISEVSKFTLQTKTAGSQTGYQIQKVEDFVELKRIPIWFDHGTVVIIEELFFNTPVRQKFLKSAQTEYFYIYQLFVDFALVHFDKAMILKKNNNTVFNLQATDSIGQRFLDLFKKDRLDQIKTLDYSDEKIGLSGIIWDAALCFWAPDNIKLFVNQRPVNDKIMKKAILSAYDRQIKPGEYPLACVFLDIQPNLVDVNVHPRKLEVKFLDPGSIYNLVNMVIKQTLGEQKIMTMNQEFSKYQAHSSTPSYQSQWSIKSNNISSTLPAQSSFFQAQSVFQQNSLAQETVDESFSLRDSSGEYKLVGQLRQSYIQLEQADQTFFIDQHALAERIAFEKMKKNFEENGKKPSILLTPISLSIQKLPDLDEKITQLESLGFDIAPLWENTIVIYAVPTVLQTFQIDLNLILQKIIFLDPITLDSILHEIFATKACKLSIKAGQKLSPLEMQNLIKDWFTHIDGMFVCQHGRPFFVSIDKKIIDKMFDRT